MITNREPKARSNPEANALLASLRCPKCQHFHRYEECSFPRCVCEPRANYPRMEPIDAIDMDELEGNEP